MSVGTLITPDKNFKCAPVKGTTCYKDCKEVLDCSCGPEDISLTVYSTNNFELTQAQKDQLDAQCPGGYTPSQQIADGNTVSDPSKCDIIDPTKPDNFSRVVCYKCNPEPTPEPTEPPY